MCRGRIWCYVNNSEQSGKHGLRGLDTNSFLTCIERTRRAAIVLVRRMRSLGVDFACRVGRAKPFNVRLALRSALRMLRFEFAESSQSLCRSSSHDQETLPYQKHASSSFIESTEGRGSRQHAGALAVSARTLIHSHAHRRAPQRTLPKEHCAQPHHEERQMSPILRPSLGNHATA